MTLTVEAFPGSDVDAPFVDVLVSGFPVGTDSFTVRRASGGRSFPVRGLAQGRAAGAASVRDYEAGIGVLSSYRTEFFDVEGLSLGFDSPVEVMLPAVSDVWGDSVAWFHDPLDPSTSVRVSLSGGAGHPISRPIGGDVVYPQGRSLGVVFPGTRQGVRRLTLDCVTESDVDGARFDALFGGYDSDALGIVCVRARPRTRFPSPLFAFIGEPVSQARDYDSWALNWALEGDEVSPPVPAIVVPLLTYQDHTDFYATYQEFTDAYPDYITGTRDYTVKES